MWIRPLGEFWTWSKDEIHLYNDCNLTLVYPHSQRNHGGLTFHFSIKWSIQISCLYWNNNVSKHHDTRVSTTCWKQEWSVDSTWFCLSRKSISCVLLKIVSSLTQDILPQFPLRLLPPLFFSPRLKVNSLTWAVRFFYFKHKHQKKKKELKQLWGMDFIPSKTEYLHPVLKALMESHLFKLYIIEWTEITGKTIFILYTLL